MPQAQLSICRVRTSAIDFEILSLMHSINLQLARTQKSSAMAQA